MLTSFFGKSKPVNFITIILLMAIFFFWANLQELISQFSLAKFAAEFSVLIAFLLSVSILNFISKKNELTKRSAYKIVIFAVCAVSFPAILHDNQVIISNLCILLALRRIISLKSYKEIQQKIFDATFWICIASLFYFWSILFLIVVYSGILLYAANYFKNWLIPPVAIMAVLALVTSFHIVAYDEFYSFSTWYQESSFQFEHYRNPALLIPLSIILALTLWTLFPYFGLMQKSSINARPTYSLVLMTLIVAVAVAIFAPTKNGSELLFFFVPFSIIASNYFERKKERVFKEILLAALILMPFLLPVFF